MPNMTINEAAEYFGVSKEAIHNRVRRGSLNVEVVDGVKYVVVDTSVKAQSKPRVQARRTASKASGDRYYKFLEEQNSQLQTKVEKLEDETRTLRDQKEEMLVQERIKIEQIYKEKDEQLKNFLNTLSSQFMLNAPNNPQIQEEHLDAEIEEVKTQPSEAKKQGELISLKKHLKTMNVSKKKREKIKEKFKKRLANDNRIITVGSKIYLDTSKYDYSDLIK